MKAKDTEQGLTQAELHRRFIYDPATGKFFYRVATSNNLCSKIGEEAGMLRDGKYIVIVIDGYAFYAHRLAWLYTKGRWPKRELDHRNTIKTDNRLRNLRLATTAQNQSNVAVRKDSKTGYKGVTLCHGKFKAQICKARKLYYLGLYNTAEEAYAAYCKASDDLHGNFKHVTVKSTTVIGPRTTRDNRDLLSEGVKANNSTGLRGVSPLGTRFRAQIYIEGKAVHLGLFDTKELAHEAYVKAVTAARPNFVRVG